MPHWLLKAGIQKTLALLPGGGYLHRWGQRIFSHRVHETFLADRLAHVERHLAAWTARYPESLPGQVMELGTGWCPVVPLGLWLCGCSSIHTYDLRPLLRTGALTQLYQGLLDWGRRGRLAQALPCLHPERLARLQALPSPARTPPAIWLDQLGIDYRLLPLRPPAADLLISNNTFEHIPTPALEALLPQLWQALRPGGVMSHYIDLVDHYAYTDPQLSPFNFLRYSPRQWQWIENRFQSQNRLRLPQYEALYRQAGIPLDQVSSERGEAAALAKLRLHADFDRFSPAELLVTYAHLISHRRP